MKMNSPPRPRIKIERTPLDNVLEALGIWGIIMMVFLTVQYWDMLPSVIPTHFGPSGQADAWGGKEHILMLPVLGTLMYSFMALLSKYPHIYNYMCKITPENAAFQYGLAVALMNYLRTYLALLFSYLQYQTIFGALGRSDGLGAWFLPLTLVGSFVPVAIYIIASLRTR